MPMPQHAGISCKPARSAKNPAARMLLLDWLVQRYPTAKRTTLKRLAEEGRVRVNGRVIKRLKQELGEGDAVEIREGGPPPAAKPSPKLPFTIIHEDQDVLVVEKPPRLLTSTGPREHR